MAFVEPLQTFSWGPMTGGKQEDRDQMKQRKAEIVERYGPWTAHNIHLGNELYTINGRLVGDEFKLRCILQVIADVAGKPLNELRVLDLACLEGLYAIELARHGASVVAIEGRRANIEKARFAKEALELSNLELFQDDVRNLTKERYGVFDVVLCMGILYHLDVPDAFSFVEAIGEVCQKFTIFDTEVSISGEKSYSYGGKLYWGIHRMEHKATSTLEERANALWASLDNPTSFCLTRASLFNLLSHVGFTSVCECHIPRVVKSFGRIILLAMKGQPQAVVSSPLVNTLPQQKWPEGAGMYHHLVKVGRLFPDEIRNALLRLFLR